MKSNMEEIPLQLQILSLVQNLLSQTISQWIKFLHKKYIHIRTQLPFVTEYSLDFKYS